MGLRTLRVALRASGGVRAIVLYNEDETRTPEDLRAEVISSRKGRKGFGNFKLVSMTGGAFIDQSSWWRSVCGLQLAAPKTVE